jgi:hypothetical protein
MWTAEITVESADAGWLQKLVFNFMGRRPASVIAQLYIDFDTIRRDTIEDLSLYNYTQEGNLMRPKQKWPPERTV